MDCILYPCYEVKGIMSHKSTIDVAYDILAAGKDPLPFSELFKKAAEELQIPETKLQKKKSSLYSALMLDNRFVSLSGNVWDLRKRHRYEDVHVEIPEDEEDEEEETESEEEEDMSLELPENEDNYD